MSDHADERRAVRRWDDGYAVGRQDERERVQATLRAIYADRKHAFDYDDMGLLEEVAAALGVTLEQEGGQ